MQHTTSTRKGVSALAATAVGAGMLALATPAHAAPPALSAPEIFGGLISGVSGGSLTGDGTGPFGTPAAYATIGAPASVVTPDLVVRWTYSNSDPVSAATRISFQAYGYYACNSATFNAGSCEYVERSRTPKNDQYYTADTFLVTMTGAPAGKYIFPILTLGMKDGSSVESRATTGSLVTPPMPSVDAPDLLTIQPLASSSLGAEEVSLQNTRGMVVRFNEWTGIGTRTPSRALRIFDCPAAFTQAVPPAQPSGCTQLATRGATAATGATTLDVPNHDWQVGRYLVATDTLALASPGLLTAHERASSYRVVDASTTVNPNAPADPNAPVDPNAPAGGGNAGGGNAGGGATGGTTEAGTTVDPGSSARIGINPDRAPAVSENGTGVRNAVTMRILAPSKVARGVKKVYRAVLTPTAQAGKVIFTIARPKADGSMTILKKASAKVKKGTARASIAVSKKAAKGKVKVFASYLPKPVSNTGMTVSKAMTLR